MLDPAKLAALAASMQALPGADIRPMSESTELHADGDYLAYYCSGNDETSFGAARRNTLDLIENVAQIAGAAGRKVLHLTSGLSCKGSRYIIATEKVYQGQRDGSRKPKNWEAMRTWLESGDIGYGWTVKNWVDREADDGVAAAARYAIQCGRTPAIFSRDKDFRMIPGLHVDWDTLGMTLTHGDTFAVYGIDGEKLYGAKWFWQQMLQGDSADNIPGCAKVMNDKGDKLVACGEKTAEKLLAACKSSEDCFKVVQNAYTQCYGATTWADRFTEQACLLWLRTDNKANIDDFLKAVPAHVPALEVSIRKLEKRIAQVKSK